MAQLYYFDDIGKGEAIKLALDLAQVEYENCVVKPAVWPEMKWNGLAKGTLPFGQLPLLKIDGLNISQSTSILRYLSRKYISIDADDATQTLIDMMVEGWDDVLTAYFANLFSGAGILKAWLYNECDTLLSHLEYFYSMNNKKYFVSDEITVVDCMALACVENLMYDMPDILKNHIGLTIYINNVINHPLINHSLKVRNMLYFC